MKVLLNEICLLDKYLAFCMDDVYTQTQVVKSFEQVIFMKTTGSSNLESL